MVVVWTIIIQTISKFGILTKTNKWQEPVFTILQLCLKCTWARPFICQWTDWDVKIFLYHLKDKLIPGTLSILVRYGNINFLANEHRRIWSGMIVTIVTQSVSSGQSETGMPGPPWHPHILTDQLTLSQPGGQIMPTTLLLPHRIFRPSYGPQFIDALSRKGYLEIEIVDTQQDIKNLTPFSLLSFPILTL